MCCVDRAKGVAVQITVKPLLSEEEKALSMLHRALPPKLWFYRWLWSKTPEGKEKDTLHTILRGPGR